MFPSKSKILGLEVSKWSFEWKSQVVRKITFNTSLHFQCLFFFAFRRFDFTWRWSKPEIKFNKVGKSETTQPFIAWQSFANQIIHRRTQKLTVYTWLKFHLSQMAKNDEVGLEIPHTSWEALDRSQCWDPLGHFGRVQEHNGDWQTGRRTCTSFNLCKYLHLTDYEQQNKIKRSLTQTHTYFILTLLNLKWSQVNSKKRAELIQVTVVGFLTPLTGFRQIHQVLCLLHRILLSLNSVL